MSACTHSESTAKDIKELCIYIYAVVYACETPLLVRHNDTGQPPYVICCQIVMAYI